MIELNKDSLRFTFSEVHPEAELRVEFQRTFRIPDNGDDYPLPPGFGRFPMKHVDDCGDTVPDLWLEHGGVMLPMYQSEALWINFHSPWIDERNTEYPFAVKIAAGKINAVTGGDWKHRLSEDPQDYLVVPDQPWLDGFCVKKGLIRQFVAMPLGSGYSVEEQLTGKAEHGGLQIMVHPMKRKAFDKYFPPVKRRIARDSFALCESAAEPSMGLAAGGLMRQEIYEDPYSFDDWDLSVSSRCFVHIANSLVWRQITGQNPPTTPPTAAEYTRAGLPWFEYYNDNADAVNATGRLKKIKSVKQIGDTKGDNPLPENQSVNADKVIRLKKGLKKGQVREWEF